MILCTIPGAADNRPVCLFHSIYTKNLTWNGRKLMSYSENGTDITYKYDADGLRTQKIVNGVKHDYFYEDGLLIYEVRNGVYELYYKYDADGNLFSIHDIGIILCILLYMWYT